MDVVFEVGGTHTRVASVREGKLGEVKRVPTKQNPAEALQEIAALARECVGSDTITRMAGGVPGVISPEGTVHHSPNLPQWNGFDVAKELGVVLGTKQISVHNDADVAALAEARLGAGKGFAIVAFLVNGTGLGGSRVVEGMLDKHAWGFEPGQYLFENGATFEQMVSGRAIQKKYGVPPEQLSREQWSELTPVLARGLYTAMLFWSPEVLVLGGGVFRDENNFSLEEVSQELAKLNTMFPKLPEIRRATLGDNAGLAGCVELL